ncbi:hypothetical protein ABGB16_05550 [Micromonospora sp. B11E3]|uniref:hypothetical protein n=1 Tax=Micromonospora sp. B11E3 TaxID=3153562 RepID=UPI00325D43EE
MPVQPTVHPALCASGNFSALSDARLLSALATLQDALAPGKALNLPVVLDRTALLDVLSVLATNTPAATAVPTAGHSVPAPVRLDRLSYGELAVAIHAAGIPAKAASLTAEQIKALAVAGITRLGLAEIYRLDAESRQANGAYCDKTRYDDSADVRAEVATIRRIWGSGKQEQTAANLAYRLSRAIARGQVTA